MAEDQSQDPRRPATERAEELLDRAGSTAGFFVSRLGIHLARIAAFAREEAEDMWAEAQSMRRQNVGAGSNEDVRARTSEDAGVSRPEAEEQRPEPERHTEPDGEAKAGTAAEAALEAEEQETKPEQSIQADGEAETIKATETARQRAEELGVDLREVEGTGASGKITAGDVKRKAQAES